MDEGASNGKPTRLTRRLWLLVRPPAFKAWFGDWENAPANASKVLDANGEPLVVYHGSEHAGFTVFDSDYWDEGMLGTVTTTMWEVAPGGQMSVAGEGSPLIRNARGEPGADTDTVQKDLEEIKRNVKDNINAKLHNITGQGKEEERRPALRPPRGRTLHLLRLGLCLPTFLPPVFPFRTCAITLWTIQEIFLLDATAKVVLYYAAFWRK